MKAMKKIIAFAGVAFAFACAAETKSGTCTGVRLDMRAKKTVASRTAGIVYDAAWKSGGAKAVVYANGGQIAQGTKGVYSWTMSCVKTNSMQLAIRNSSNQTLETLTATVVNGSASADEHTPVVTAPRVEPTVREAGHTEEVSCSVCGKVLEAAETIPALGYVHNLSVRQLWPHKKVEVCWEMAEGVSGETLELTCGAGSSVNTSWSWVHDSGYRWTADSSTWKEGGSSWKSGNKGVQNSSSSIWTTVNKAKRVTFWWKVSSESGYDYLKFFVNGTEKVTKIAGDVDWTKVTVDLDSTTAQTLKWTYSKDGSQDSGSDCGWIDGVEIEFDTADGTTRARTVYGDAGCGSGVHRVVWDLEADGVSVDRSDLTFTVKYGDLGKTSEGVRVNTTSSVSDGMNMAREMRLGYSPIDAGEAVVKVDGVVVVAATNSGEFVWRPRTKGSHTIVHEAGGRSWSRRVNVTETAYPEIAMPNPPCAPLAGMSIGKTAQSMAASGGTFSITTSKTGDGSVTWTATVSDPDWLSFNGLSSRAAGQSCIVKVAENLGAEARTGYVYVSGHVCTVTQAGAGCELDAYSAEFGPDGGSGEVLVLADGQRSWNAISECDWISVAETAGTGEKYLQFTVAPYAAVADRTGYVTIGGKSFEVHQSGRPMAVSRIADSFDWQAHAVEIDVSALQGVEWFATPMASWIAVVAPAEGRATGSGRLLLSINENPSWLARSGYVTVGSERYAVEQTGRPQGALEFAISPERTSASVYGANGLIAVSATPDLPWTAESKANWLTVMPVFQSGAGDGNIVYVATPNSTMSERTGTIEVSADARSGEGTRTHTVVQPAAAAAIAESEHGFAAAGDSFEVEVSVGNDVNWTVENGAAWIAIDDGNASVTRRIGPGRVKIGVAANPGVDAREATITIAGHEFKVSQRGHSVEVSCESVVFNADGGGGTLEVHPNGTVEWRAVSDAPWLTIWAEDGATDNPDGSVGGNADATVGYWVDPYVGDGESLTATITIGDKVTYVTQRAYDASISPRAATVAGTAGAGEFGFSASIDDVWDALNILCSKDWIESATVTAFDANTKSGTIRYTYRANDSGVPRNGTIMVAGETYVLTQQARQIVRIAAVAEGSGSVTGAGTYDAGTQVTLSATPAAGHEFIGWYSGESLANASAQFSFNAVNDRNLTAKFAAIPTFTVNGQIVQRGTAVACAAPADELDASGTRKRVCLGTSAFPDKGRNFTLTASEDVAFEWDLWTTNWLVTVDGASAWHAHGSMC